MSAIQHFFPSNGLAAALKKAPPRTVKECLKQADENLRQIADACLAHVDASLGLLEVMMSRWSDAPDREHLSAMYDSALRIVGVASVARLDQLDAAAKSLCEVIDDLMQNDVWVRDPVAVHVSAMRLLRSPDHLGDGGAAIVDGLRRVRNRYRERSGPTLPPAAR